MTAPVVTRAAVDTERPIIVVGAARSGTTMLANHVLAHHPDVAYWNEPAHVWRFGHGYRRHDVLSDADATPAIRAYIRSRFAAALRESGRRRFMEKTPSNCLRLPFVHRVFPDAKFLHILRDGRDVAWSAAIEWRGDKPLSAAAENGGGRVSLTLRQWLARRAARVRPGSFPVKELPAYALRVAREVARRSLPGRTFVWGPRFPGIEDVAQTYSLLETCAIQWDWSVRAAVAYGRNLDRSQYIELKYEDFVMDPREHLAQILRFLDLDGGRAVLDDLVTRVRRDEANKWRHTYRESDLRRVLAHVEPTLRYLGYDS